MKFVLGIVIGSALTIVGYSLYEQYIATAPVAPVVTSTPQTLDVFRFTLEDEVKKRRAVAAAGYTPELLLETFPGLVVSDFAGVSGSGGTYVITSGTLEFVRDETGLVPETVGGLNRAGYGSLLENVTNRLDISLRSDGTITDIITALARPRSAEQ